LGVNALRTAHNPPATGFLELADEMGFLVLNEIFDSWERKKTPLDFHLIFPDWSEPDLRAFVRRDRNHPSVFLWSVGNEVGEQYTGAEGARVEVSNTAIVGAGLGAVVGDGPATSLQVERSLARDTVPSVDPFSAGIFLECARATLRDTTVIGSTSTGLLVTGPGEADVEGSIVRETVPGDPRFASAGIEARGGATLRLNRSAIVANEGYGLFIGDEDAPGQRTRAFVRDASIRYGRSVPRFAQGALGIVAKGGSQLEIDRTLVIDTQAIAVAVFGALTQATIRHSHVLRTHPGFERRLGVGIALADSSSLSLEDSVISDSEMINLYLGGGVASVARSLLSNARAQNTAILYGYGIQLNAGARLELTDSELRGNEGVALIAAGGTAAVRRSVIARNATALHAQNGSVLRESSTDEPPAEREILIGTDTLLLGNATRLGTGELPLPPEPRLDRRG
ncbi:MAG: right-handed parallel beta-helix repeat-containing protein, partial [Myxococcales bacterium]